MVNDAEEALQTQLPGLFLTGGGMRGLGVPDCIRQARETAAELQPFLRQQELQAAKPV